jgi:hypothetical protein
LSEPNLYSTNGTVGSDGQATATRVNELHLVPNDGLGPIGLMAVDL